MKLLLVNLLLILSSCKKDSAAVLFNQPDTSAVVSQSFSFLALGDSYTVGQNVGQPDSYPYLLSKSLSAETPSWKASPITVIAQTGWTTDNLITAISGKNITGKFDIVTLLIGVNNQFRGYSPAAYRQEFIALLNTALKLANGDKSKVFVLSIPDWGATPYGSSYNREQIAREIDEFNAINKDETVKAGIDYTDVTAISRMALTDKSLIANDGLHPSGKMYQSWVDILAPKILLRLKNN